MNLLLETTVAIHYKYKVVKKSAFVYLHFINFRGVTTSTIESFLGTSTNLLMCNIEKTKSTTFWTFSTRTCVDDMPKMHVGSSLFFTFSLNILGKHKMNEHSWCLFVFHDNYL